MCRSHWQYWWATIYLIKFADRSVVNLIILHRDMDMLLGAREWLRSGAAIWLNVMCSVRDILCILKFVACKPFRVVIITRERQLRDSPHHNHQPDGNNILMSLTRHSLVRLWAKWIQFSGDRIHNNSHQETAAAAAQVDEGYLGISSFFFDFHPPLRLGELNSTIYGYWGVSGGSSETERGREHISMLSIHRRNYFVRTLSTGQWSPCSEDKKRRNSAHDDQVYLQTNVKARLLSYYYSLHIIMRPKIIWKCPTMWKAAKKEG